MSWQLWSNIPVEAIVPPPDQNDRAVFKKSLDEVVRGIKDCTIVDYGAAEVNSIPRYENSAPEAVAPIIIDKRD